jgi:hypothetical protein
MKRLIVVFAVLLLGIWCFGNLHARSVSSEAFTDRLLTAINAGKPISLLSLVAETSPDVDVLCLIGPYASISDFLPRGAKFARQADMVDIVDENDVAVVVLNVSGEVVDVLLVRRSRFDLTHTNLVGRCYQGRMENPSL